MATSCICIVLCSFHALQPDLLYFKQNSVLVPALPPTSWMTLGKWQDTEFLVSEVGRGTLSTSVLQVYKLHALTNLDHIDDKALKTLKCYTNVRHYYFSN